MQMRCHTVCILLARMHIILYSILLIFMSSHSFASGNPVNCQEYLKQKIAPDLSLSHRLDQQTRVILAVREAFKTLRDDPQVLDPYLAALNKKYYIKSLGFSYTGAAAVYYMLGGEDAGLAPYKSVNIRNPRSSRTWKEHWWLKDTQRGILIDPTADQFASYYDIGMYDLTGPYRRGKIAQFDDISVPVEKIILKATEILEKKGFSPNGLKQIQNNK